MSQIGLTISNCPSRGFHCRWWIAVVCHSTSCWRYNTIAWTCTAQNWQFLKNCLSFSFGRELSPGYIEVRIYITYFLDVGVLFIYLKQNVVDW